MKGVFIPVKAVSDDSGHWYIIPLSFVKDFHQDLSNDDMVDSGGFDDKYRQYRTGGDLNLTQLYIKQQ